MGQVSFNEDRIERLNELLNEVDKFHRNFQSYSDTERTSRWNAISKQIESAKREIALILENATNPLIDSAYQNLRMAEMHNAEKSRMGADRKKLQDNICTLEEKLANKNKEISALKTMNSQQLIQLEQARSDNQRLRALIDEERNARATMSKWMGS